MAIVSLNKISPYLSLDLFLPDTQKMGNGLFWLEDSSGLSNLSIARNIYAYSIFSSFPRSVPEFSSTFQCQSFFFLYYYFLFGWFDTFE